MTSYLTEDQIERAVERKVDALDQRFIECEIDHDTYLAEMRKIDRWADDAMRAIPRPGKVEVGTSVVASGYRGTVVGVAPSHPSYGYIPEGMVAVSLPGGVRLACVGELSL